MDDERWYKHTCSFDTKSSSGKRRKITTEGRKKQRRGQTRRRQLNSKKNKNKKNRCVVLFLTLRPVGLQWSCFWGPVSDLVLVLRSADHGSHVKCHVMLFCFTGLISVLSHTKGTANRLTTTPSPRVLCREEFIDIEVALSGSTAIWCYCCKGRFYLLLLLLTHVHLNKQKNKKNRHVYRSIFLIVQTPQG